MQTPHILLVVTSADRMEGSASPTGTWLEEFAAPYFTFVDAKCAITVASPQGGAAPIDQTSLQPENLTAATRRYDADPKAKQAMGETKRLADLNPSDYDAIFFAGGHGTMVDFPRDASVKGFVEAFYANGKPVSAVCHGPACLVAATKANGEPLIAGHRFTCFSNAEETTVGLHTAVPFMLETTLTELGGIPSTAPDFHAHVIVDGKLITGQNPASAIPVAEEVIQQLRARKKHPLVAA